MPEKLSKPAKLFYISNIMNGLGNGIFNVILQLYLLQIGFTASDLGTIFMMSSLSMFLFMIPSGILADKYGNGKIIIAGWIPLIIQMGIILSSSSIELISLAWFLNGIGNATSNAVIGPFFSSLFEKEELDKAFGLRGFINIVSMSIGSLMGLIPPYLVANYGFSLRSSYWFMLLLAIIMFITQIPFYLLIFKYVKDEKHGNGFSFNLQSKDVVIKYSIIQIIQGIAFNPFISFFPYFVNNKFGVESDGLGSIQFISYFVQAGSNLIAPKIAEKYGSVKTISLALISAAPFFALFTVAPSFIWLSVIYIARLSIASVCNPLLPSLFYRLVHPEEKATANSISTMASVGTNTFTPKIGAYLMENISINAPALLAALLYPIYGTTFYYFFKNNNLKNQKLVEQPIKTN